MAPPQVPQAQSAVALSGRIQGFGNVNPPPLPEDDAKTMAKRAAGRLSDIVGEELVLTVQDFKEKGAVGAVKDAVFDAGDILIDGVSGVFGWLRGDPPPEEEMDEEKSQAAQDVLKNAPRGAAYGVSQASPSGGINAVWVMPEEADPAMLQELARQQAAAPPPNVQPYQAPGSSFAPPPYCPGGGQPMQIPGGPVIAPYEPPSKHGGFVPGMPGMPPRLPPGVSPGAFAAPRPGGLGQAPATGGAGGAGRVKALVEQVASGATAAGPEVARRLVGTCSSTQVSAEQLGEALAERARRIYLGLDCSSAADSDGALSRLVALAAALAQQDAPLGRQAARLAARKAPEEFQSLRSSAAHRAAVEPHLRALGLAPPAAECVDLLGGDAPAPQGARGAAPTAAAQVDLLDVGQPVTSSTTATTDLLGF